MNQEQEASMNFWKEPKLSGKCLIRNFAVNVIKAKNGNMMDYLIY